ncbi:MAG: hypothetical protein KGI75_23270, partial [Rhizobiaceae bacterium]|nr:hypothetical protein [Rhizobiaceae bacterium]
MRSRAIAAAAVFSISLAGISQAADVSEQGAKDLRNALTHSLSRDLARSDFVTVKPGAGEYEITYDFEKFFDKINSSVLSVTGLKPLTLMAEPLEHGQWGIKGDNAVDFAVATPDASMNYSI